MSATGVPILDSRNAEACRRILDQSGSLYELLAKFGCGTLSGLVECFLTCAQIPVKGAVSLRGRGGTRELVDPWQSLIEAWFGEQNEPQMVLRAQELEFRRIDPEHWGDGIGGWINFEQRFRSGLLANGFSSEFAHGLLRVFHEMADNVVQHGALDGGSVGGVAGYHVGPGRFAFSIGDRGCGYLRSLHQSPSWKHLESESAAVKAVIYEGASRRSGQGEGEGFRQLWKALADHGAHVRLRSSNAVALIRMTGAGREAALSSVPDSMGSHISVCCSLGRPTVENEHNFPLLNH